MSSHQSEGQSCITKSPETVAILQYSKTTVTYMKKLRPDDVPKLGIRGTVSFLKGG